MYIIDNDGNEEMLIGFQENSVVVRRNLEGKYELDFTIEKTRNNQVSYNMVQDFSVINLNGENFVVRMVREGPYSKSVSCVHEFYNLIDNVITGYLPNQLTTIQTALNFIFPARLGWTVSLSGTFSPAILNDFGNKNVISLLNTIREQYGCEYVFSSTDKRIVVSNRIGVDTEFQVRNGHNLVTIEKNIDSTDVKTAITVNYNPRDGVYRSSVTYTSPLASRYPTIKYADPINFDTTSQEVARNYGALQINDSPRIAIRLEFAQLRNNGYNSNDLSIGNTFYLIDERINENEVARIIEVDYYPFSSRSPLVTVANRQKYYTDIGIRQIQLQSVLNDQIQRFNSEVVKKNESLDGVVLTEANGLQVNQTGNGVAITINASEGILIENNSVRKFYVNPSGDVVLDGRLTVSNSEGNTTLLNAFMNNRGGVIDIYNNLGVLNAKLGSENVQGVTGGGSLNLYDDSGNNTVKILGNSPNAFSQSSGRMILSGSSRIEIDSGRSLGGIRISSGSDVLEIFPNNIYINGNAVLTE